MGDSNAQCIAGLPEKLQPCVTLWFARLAEQDATLPDDLVAPVSRFVACSEFAAKVLLREFRWFIENVASFSNISDNVDLDDLVETVAIFGTATCCGFSGEKFSSRQILMKRCINFLILLIVCSRQRLDMLKGN